MLQRWRTGSLPDALFPNRPYNPLVQSFCPGHGLGHMIFMHGGEALIRFQHRRISEWPPEGGSSTICESLPLTENADLLQKSVELLRAIGWEGAAMVEYRFEPRTGRAMLMEVNGRFWAACRWRITPVHISHGIRTRS